MSASGFFVANCGWAFESLNCEGARIAANRSRLFGRDFGLRHRVYGRRSKASIGSQYPSVCGRHLGLSGLRFVDDYAQAFAGAEREIGELLKTQAVTVGWLIDGTVSMQTDRKIVQAAIIGTVESLAKEAEQDKQQLMFGVSSFGYERHVLADTTADIEKIREAVKVVPACESGKTDLGAVKSKTRFLIETKLRP